ncbi:unnamed protein product [Rhizoctonia solani]|uniref:Uncharacterized protein n=1 Tax=Rhizoctonia solani TaxID=456999 RepID=A0A8H3HDG6_9AGAM|nr:unnamed protein product [Rhizoctonia solani]
MNGEHAPDLLDSGDLADTFAMAADALAAAAEALAEAARAMSDASETPDRSNDIAIFPSIIPLANVPADAKPHTGNEAEPRDFQNGVDQHAPHEKQNMYQFGQAAVTMSSSESSMSISSDSTHEMTLLSLRSKIGEQGLGEESSSLEPENELVDGTSEPELNNALNALPSSPIRLNCQSGPAASPNMPVKGDLSSDSQSNVAKFQLAMKPSHVLPSGRNYICLDHASDALAFIAYMALQVNRVVCLIPEQVIDNCSQLLRSLTDANVHRITTFHQFQSLIAAFQISPKFNAHDIVLIPSLMTNILSSPNIYPDCLLHWDQPANADYWMNRVLTFLSPTVRVCILLVGEQCFNGRVHGVVPYPSAVLASCYDSNSPFHLLRQISSQLHPKPKPPPLTGSQVLGPRLNLHPSIPSITLAQATYDQMTSAGLAPVVQPPSGAFPTRSRPELNGPRLVGAMLSQPKVPPGRNYIHLDKPSDALAFIAYMALQFHRIFCVVPSSHQSIYADVLKSLTHASIHLAETPDQFQGVSAKLLTPGHAFYNVILAPCNNSWMTESRIKQLNPDCVLHWSQPASVYFFTTRRIVNSLDRTVRTCVIVVSERSFDGATNGVQLYPNSVLNVLFQSNSPFQELTQISSQLLPAPAMTPVAPCGPTSKRVPILPASKPSSSRTPNVPINSISNGAALPVGHYYIVLDHANDIDIVSMVTYLALNTKKMICYIPSEKDLAKYNILISRISNASVLAPTLPKGKPSEKMVKGFKSQNSGIWLRTISSQWNSHWAKSLVDGVIYWGIPSDLTYYLKECKLKVDTSYLCLTTSEYFSIQSQLNRIKPHPNIHASDATRTGSPLHDLRQKLLPHL